MTIQNGGRIEEKVVMHLDGPGTEYQWPTVHAHGYIIIKHTLIAQIVEAKLIAYK